MQNPCNLCRSSDSEQWYHLTGRDILRCRSCGFAWTQFHEGVKLADLYTEDYFTDVHSSYFRDCRADYMERETTSPKLKRFRHYVFLLQKFQPSGKLLDSGCATGVFLHMAQRAGYDVRGLDISKFAQAYARKHFGITVHLGKFEELRLKEQLDAVTMWDFLEHVENPTTVVKNVHRLLAPKGYFFVMTTNEHSLMSFLAGVFYRIGFGKGIFRTPAELIYPKHHLHFFTEKTLRRLLESQGFVVVWKEKSEMPAATIEGSWFIRLCARLLYAVSWVFRWQHEITFVAQKQ